MKGELVSYFPEPIDVKEFVDTLTWFQVEIHPLQSLFYLHHATLESVVSEAHYLSRQILILLFCRFGSSPLEGCVDFNPDILKKNKINHERCTWACNAH